MMVMVGLLPFAGNALPFVSAGGSNLVSSLAAIGILLNISRQQRPERARGRRETWTVRLLVCAGGTGGGAFPALAVLQALNARHANVETLWVGSESGMEAELVGREGVPFASIPAAGLHGVGLASLPRNLTQLARGFVASRRILNEFRPDVLFFTGGYLAGPMALAGRCCSDSPLRA